MNGQEVVDVYAAANGIEAHFLRGLLADEGIEAQVVGDTAQATGYTTLTRPRLWVHQSDAERSREILAAWERECARPRDDDRVPPTWKCPTCGSDVDEELQMCWQCQTPRVPY